MARNQLRSLVKGSGTQEKEGSIWGNIFRLLNFPLTFMPVAKTAIVLLRKSWKQKKAMHKKWSLGTQM